MEYEYDILHCFLCGKNYRDVNRLITSEGTPCAMPGSAHENRHTEKSENHKPEGNWR